MSTDTPKTAAQTPASAQPPKAQKAGGGGFRDTLNLPKDVMPMKANLVQNEPASIKRWQAMKLYDKLREQARSASPPLKRFVFHDGPPYANGSLHLGHLMNKCLKDFVVRSRTMMGFDCPYVPGWDCHGLPIEHKVMTELVEKGKWQKIKDLPEDQRRMIVRKESQAYAEKSQKLQRGQMERFLTLADYEHPYLTMQPEFEGATLEVLADLVEKGLVYRALKPVHWSIANETALAEAELEYMDREDPSVYVDFEAVDAAAVYDAFGLTTESTEDTEEDEAGEEAEGSETEPPAAAGGHGAPKPGTRPRQTPTFMIWTTTPWTLPANLAIAVNPKYEYALVWVDGNVTVIAEALVEKVTKLGKAEQVVVLAKTSGDKLVGLRYRHPFVDPARGEGAQPGAQATGSSTSTGSRARGGSEGGVDPVAGAPGCVFRVVPADYVTLEDGTGLVHTAPGHGTEDFDTGKREGLPIYCPVRSDGTYDKTVPAWLQGLDIWKANDKVVTHLRESGHMFHDLRFTHSYPHDWRSKTPTIFRCTEQWFIKVDEAFKHESEPAWFWGNSLRRRALGCVGLDLSAPVSPLQHEYAKELLARQNAPDEGRAPQSPRFDEIEAGIKDLEKYFREHPKRELEARGLLGEPIKFVPEWGRNRMRGMLESRPDWCISRQRSWGQPIPAFFWKDDSGKEGVLLTAQSVRAVARRVRESGSDIWFTATTEQLLKDYDAASDPQAPEEIRKTPSLALRAVKGPDIIDVWFESGSTWNAVMRQRAADPKTGGTSPDDRGGGFPCDLYLEGSDQHRGWFQSSLLNSLGATGVPPFKTLLTHGFIVDKDGKKLSKSRSDAARYEVDNLCAEFGMDVMRWWVSSLPFENDIKADLDFFASSGESYRKIRNTLRFLVSNLYDLPLPPLPDGGGRGKGDSESALESLLQSALPQPLPSGKGLSPTSLDAWVLSEFDKLAATVQKAYEEYDFRTAHLKLYDFCNDTLSATYLAAVKDRLYCDKPGSARRRQTQAALFALADGLSRLLAPVMCHTADEAFRLLWKVDPKDQTISVHLKRFVTTGGGPGLCVKADEGWAAVLEARAAAQQAMERSKSELGVENPMEMGVALPDPKGVLARFDRFDLADLLGVSRVTIDAAATAPKVIDLRAEPRCERSWKRDGTVKPRGPQGAMLSDRDAEAVGLS